MISHEEVEKILAKRSELEKEQLRQETKRDVAKEELVTQLERLKDLGYASLGDAMKRLTEVSKEVEVQIRKIEEQL